MTEYLFGVRHRPENDERIIELLTEHRYATTVAPTGIFFQPGTEHVSVVIGNPQGIVSKFNRIGYLVDSATAALGCLHGYTKVRTGGPG